MDLNFFNFDEKIVINQISNLNFSISRNDLSTKIAFVLAISTDDDIIELYKNLQTKVDSLSESQWIAFSKLLPFVVPYDASKVEELVEV